MAAGLNYVHPRVLLDGIIPAVMLTQTAQDVHGMSFENSEIGIRMMKKYGNDQQLQGRMRQAEMGEGASTFVTSLQRFASLVNTSSENADRLRSTRQRRRGKQSTTMSTAARVRIHKNEQTFGCRAYWCRAQLRTRHRRGRQWRRPAPRVNYTELDVVLKKD